MSTKAKAAEVKARKSFKTLQQTATDKENLAGRPARNVKELVSNRDGVVKPKQSRQTQASFTNQITAEDLTTDGEPSLEYWKSLAEKRKEALDETLIENEQLCARVEELESELEIYKKMLEEANSFVEAFQEMVDENEDTGIDVNDVSTADESPAKSDSEPGPSNKE